MVPTKKPAIAATQRRAVDGDMLTDESRSGFSREQHGKRKTKFLLEIKPFLSLLNASSPLPFLSGIVRSSMRRIADPVARPWQRAIVSSRRRVVSIGSDKVPLRVASVSVAHQSPLLTCSFRN